VIRLQFSNSSADGLWLEKYETTPVSSKGMVILSLDTSMECFDAESNCFGVSSTTMLNDLSWLGQIKV
jgi:hypothetical protein